MQTAPALDRVFQLQLSVSPAEPSHLATPRFFSCNITLGLGLKVFSELGALMGTALIRFVTQEQPALQSIVLVLGQHMILTSGVIAGSALSNYIDERIKSRIRMNLGLT